MSNNILLIGCTGFIGQCIIYTLLKDTNYDILLVIRTKHNTSIENRLDIILKNINLENNPKIKERIKLTNIEYQKENNMNIYFVNNTLLNSQFILLMIM